MYTKHFGLKVLPFESAPDSRFFFDQGDYARIRKQITASLKADRGLIVVDGPEGSGKTTLSQIIVSDFLNEMEIIWMAAPPKYGKELFLLIARELGLKQSESERVFVINDIKDAIINSEGSKCLLIIDESHLMADGTLSSITILNNLKEGQAKLIQVLLFGREEILERISRPDMESFKRRVTALEHIGGMSPNNVRSYILHRINAAGGDPSIISDTGLEALILACCTGRAVPGVINLLCSRSLRIAFEKNKEKVEIDDVCKAADGMGIAKEVYRYMVTLRATEGRRRTASTITKKPVREAGITGKGPGHSRDRISEDTMINKSEAPGSSQGEPENVSAPEREEKGFRNHCKAFLKKILRTGDGIPEEKIEPEESPVEAEENRPAEINKNAAYLKGEKTENEEKTPATPDEPAAMDAENTEELRAAHIKDNESREQEISPSEWITIDSTGTSTFKPSEIKDEKPEEKKKIAEINLSSEWITTDMKGTKTFEAADVKERNPENRKAAAAELDGWVSLDAKKPGISEIPDIENKEFRKKEEAASSTEWVKMEIKGIELSKSTENKKPGERKAEKNKTLKKKTVKKKAVKKKADKKAAVKSG